MHISFEELNGRLRRRKNTTTQTDKRTERQKDREKERERERERARTGTCTRGCCSSLPRATSRFTLTHTQHARARVHTHTHEHTQARARAHTHTLTHTHTHTHTHGRFSTYKHARAFTMDPRPPPGRGRGARTHAPRPRPRPGNGRVGLLSTVGRRQPSRPTPPHAHHRLLDQVGCAWSDDSPARNSLRVSLSHPREARESLGRERDSESQTALKPLRVSLSLSGRERLWRGGGSDGIKAIHSLF